MEVEVIAGEIVTQHAKPETTKAGIVQARVADGDGKLSSEWVHFDTRACGVSFIDLSRLTALRQVVENHSPNPANETCRIGRHYVV